MQKSINKLIKTLDWNRVEAKLDKKLTLPITVEGYKQCYLQGGGTDGKYGYYIINECGATGKERSKMYKVDLGTYEIVKTAQDFLWCHANDVAFDTERGLIVVSHCNEDISFVDPETLEEIEKRTLPTGGQYAIAYEPKFNKYTIGKSRCYDIGICDENFELLASYPGEDGHVKQGMECDEDYIYFLQTGVRYNWVWIYDWDGNYINKFRFDMVGESENLFIRGDKFIVAINNHEEKCADIYEMTLSERA